MLCAEGALHHSRTCIATTVRLRLRPVVCCAGGGCGLHGQSHKLYRRALLSLMSQRGLPASGTAAFSARQRCGVAAFPFPPPPSGPEPWVALRVLRLHFGTLFSASAALVLLLRSKHPEEQAAAEAGKEGSAALGMAGCPVLLLTARSWTASLTNGCTPARVPVRRTVRSTTAGLRVAPTIPASWGAAGAAAPLQRALPTTLVAATVTRLPFQWLKRSLCQGGLGFWGLCGIATLCLRCATWQEYSGTWTRILRA